MPLSLHGENGMTYALFSELDVANKMKLFLKSIRMIDDDDKFKEMVETESKTETHLFPSFGRGYGRSDVSGFGEPDVLILTNQFYVLLEVETKTFEEPMARKSVKELVTTPKGITYQLERFYFLGDTISKGMKYLKNDVLERVSPIKYKNSKDKEREGDFTRKFSLEEEKEPTSKDPQKPAKKKAMKELVQEMMRHEYFVVCLTNDENVPEIYNEWIKAVNDEYKNDEYNLEAARFGWVGWKQIIKKIVSENKDSFKLTSKALELNGLLERWLK